MTELQIIWVNLVLLLINIVLLLRICCIQSRRLNTHWKSMELLHERVNKLESQQ